MLLLIHIISAVATFLVCFKGVLAPGASISKAISFTTILTSLSGFSLMLYSNSSVLGFCVNLSLYLLAVGAVKLFIHKKLTATNKLLS